MSSITNIDEMPDCLRKYEMITQKVVTSPGWKFEDSEFSHKNESVILGDKIMKHPQKHYVAGWKRASEIKNAVLFQNGCDCRDIV